MSDSSPHATPPVPRRVHLRLIGLLLLAPATIGGMRYMQRDSQTRLTDALSQTLGLSVSLQSIETTLAPGVVLRGLRVGTIVDIPRVEIRLGFEGQRPRLRHVALIRPSFHVDLDHLPRVLRLARAHASQTPQNAARPSGSPAPSTFVSTLRGATWSIHKGRVDIAFHAGDHPLALHAVDLFALPSRPGRERIVVGETQIRADGKPLATLASVALELHGRRIERAAILGGSLALPHGATLEILTGRLRPLPHGRGLHFRVEARPPSRRGGRLVLRGNLDMRRYLPRLRTATAELRDLSLSSLNASLSPLGIHAETLRASGILDLRRDARRFHVT
ncbi:MAG: hypothetical protein KAI47_20605, partial [Deltaproteobacteria bacterium]|nr:hypothetical protein [Deltaproteobacteria bacterium]